jgi:hypothetical protein
MKIIFAPLFTVDVDADDKIKNIIREESDR